MSKVKEVYSKLLQDKNNELSELRKDHKIVLDHNKVLQDKYEEYFLLQEKYAKLKEAFNDLVEDSSVSYFVFSEPETSNYKESWFNKAGLL